MRVDGAEPTATPKDDRRFRAWLAVLAGTSAMLAACFTLFETSSGNGEEHALVDASRGGVKIFVRSAAFNPRAEFGSRGKREALGLEAQSTARIANAPAGGQAAEVAKEIAAAEHRSARQLTAVVGMLGHLPSRSSGIDAAMLEALQPLGPASLKPLIAETNQAVDDAARYGREQIHAFFALGLVAIAASLLGLAGLMGPGRGGRISLVTAGSAQVAGLLWAAVSLI